eukprot:1397999-Pleurochrysis_carterae.AAC.1
MEDDVSDVPDEGDESEGNGDCGGGGGGTAGSVESNGARASGSHYRPAAAAPKTGRYGDISWSNGKAPRAPGGGGKKTLWKKQSASSCAKAKEMSAKQTCIRAKWGKAARDYVEYYNNGNCPCSFAVEVRILHCVLHCHTLPPYVSLIGSLSCVCLI